jgi:putative Mg2+ transporter-C (MgtC) family protein
MDTLSITLKFGLTFLLAFIFGMNRQLTHKPIGFGTFIFVSVGSCGLSIIAILLNPENPLPLLSAIITGIGFLGAGALIKTSDKIFGFTSAASIWLFSILGLIIGAGFYTIALIIYFLVWTVIFFDHYLEKEGIGSYQKRLILTTNEVLAAEELNDLLQIKKHELAGMSVNWEENRFTLNLLVKIKRDNLWEITEKLSGHPTILFFRFE